jgi:hypothetical protein
MGFARLWEMANFINCLLDYKIVFENDKSCQPAREAILVRVEKTNKHKTQTILSVVLAALRISFII